MKRIIIIFIIVFCLISFTGTSYPDEEPQNVAKIWKSFTIYEKECYLIGISDGIMTTLVDFDKHEKRDEKVREIIKLLINEKYDFLFLPSLWSHRKRSAVIKVMNELYKNPDNIYIGSASMCFIAIRKLKGESIEPLLRELRKKALP